MPVIGRLDGQVDELIIKPVSVRRREDAPPETPEAARAPEPPPSAPVQTPNRGESSPEAEELPVWLL